MKRLYVVILILLCAFVLIAGSAQAALAAEKVFIKEYTYQASEADSKLTSRAMALVNSRDFDSAIEAFSKTISLDPNYAPAYTNRGRAYGAKGQFDRAMADYKKSCELGDEDYGCATVRFFEGKR